MIAVSNTWKELQKETLLPEMFVEITYRITEPGVQEEAVATASEPEEFSDVSQIVDTRVKNHEAYASLDYGSWGLDGSFTYNDGVITDPGYIYSHCSNANREFAITPEITIDFEKKHNIVIPGMDITWDKALGGWATDFVIILNNANGEVARKTVTGNTSVVSRVAMDMVDYSQIKIRILKWSHPYQRAKCVSVMLGLSTVYTKDDLLSFEHSQSVDLLSATLPENVVRFKLRNDDDRWNPDSPQGAEKYLAEQQEVTVRYGMDIGGVTEWIDGGVFWLTEWETPANGMEASFTARDAISFMEYIYTGPRSGTLYDIATSAISGANLPMVGVDVVCCEIDESLKTRQTDFSADTQEYTIAEVLQLVAHAGNCVFYQDRKGTVHIEPRKISYSNYMITPDISYTHPEYTINKPLKAVSVKYGEKSRVEVPVGSKGEIQTIDNPFIITEEHARSVGEAAENVLVNRKVISGDFRADMRIDALDNVIVTSKYASNVIAVTNITYSTTSGAFRGTYTGRVVSVELISNDLYSGEFYVGEI